jgi:hypothetical protein
MSKRTLTVQDIMLMQRQLEAAEQLNNILGQAVAEIGDAVNGIESASGQPPFRTRRWLQPWTRSRALSTNWRRKWKNLPRD